jgi:uroporphyrinogen III methyltransferase/synthase
MKRGFVYLVGAGPGDHELITEKAKDILYSADCIIYDFLANEKIFDGINCEKIYVGKQGSRHTLSQEEIGRLIIEKAREGMTVVRLKGGDPFIFGRGGEEAEELMAEGIPFSIVPGISSFYSAPAYAGIPLTHRDYANAFEVITGHRRSDADEEDINLPEYHSQKTYVFLMGVKNLEHITSQLITEKEFPEDTPAGIITWGTLPKQAVITGTVGTIAKIAREKSVKPPAIIIVGSVVLLREKLKWFDNLPLFGRRIVVTRTREQASQLSKRLYRLGADVIEFPTIEIKPREDLRELRNAIDRIEEFDWIIFTSQNAVRIFFGVLSECGRDSRSLHRNRIAAIGPATGKEVERYAIKPDLIPPEYVAEAMLEGMKTLDVAGKRVLLPCAAEARETLKGGLEELGAHVERIPIYDTIIPGNISEESLERVISSDVITFTSSSTVRNFFKIIGRTDAVLACIGPVTAETVREQGYEPRIIASEYTIDGLMNAIVSAFDGD